jgi:hypothetical protein
MAAASMLTGGWLVEGHRHWAVGLQMGGWHMGRRHMGPGWVPTVNSPAAACT